MLRKFVNDFSFSVLLSRYEVYVARELLKIVL
jgi:hypothetical protein